MSGVPFTPPPATNSEIPGAPKKASEYAIDNVTAAIMPDQRAATLASVTRQLFHVPGQNTNHGSDI